MSIIKRFKRRIHGITSEEMLLELQQGGAEIGQKVIVFDPTRTTIDSSRPWLLKIGSYTPHSRNTTLGYDHSRAEKPRSYRGN